MAANNVADLMLEGDTAAHRLQCIFSLDVTLAQIRCAICGRTTGVGALAVHAAPIGTVLKCIGCEDVLMRVVEAADGLSLEMTGASFLRFNSQNRLPASYPVTNPPASERKCSSFAVSRQVASIDDNVEKAHRACTAHL
jgi:Family of unknown function (DUF6510)